MEGGRYEHNAGLSGTTGVNVSPLHGGVPTSERTRLCVFGFGEERGGEGMSVRKQTRFDGDHRNDGGSCPPPEAINLEHQDRREDG